MMKAIITCAGYASRLWPLTKETPKPLLEVKGKPIIEHIIAKISEIKDVDTIYIVTNAKFHDKFAQWGRGRQFPIQVKLLNDSTSSNDDRLGQVGDVHFVMQQENINDDILIVAGDNLFNFSLLPLFDTFNSKRAVMNPLWESKSYKAAKESGSVVLKDDLSFAEFMEKAPQPKSTLISLGIYAFPKEKAHLIRKYLDEGNNADKMGFFLTWLMQHEQVWGHVYMDRWFDIGWIEALEQARKEFDA
jgi:glucose-1-phosphate thymidylyltransferase